jgi:DUF1365 family protein
MVEQSIVECQVKHTRIHPIKYSFDYAFDWYCIDLFKNNFPLIQFNQFGLFSFKDSDHLKYGGNGLKENLRLYLEKNSIHEEIVSASLVTMPRYLGYGFNPVSFYLIKTTLHHIVIIEIGNTFNELKPYLVKCQPNSFNFTFLTDKNFYISPFSPVDAQMEFQFTLSATDLSIQIKTIENEKTVFLAQLLGHFRPITTMAVFKSLMKNPFRGLHVIGLIHWHAAKLYLNKVPHYIKSYLMEKQTGVQKWK